MVKRKIRTGLILLLITVLVLVVSALSARAKKPDTGTSAAAKSSANQEAEAASGSIQTRDEDSGMVYLQADASGNLEKEDAGKDHPVDVKIRYFLNDKELSPKEIAGKSGRVKMRFEYENKVAKTVEADGESIEVKAPFLVVSAVMLPEDTFSNVEISNGKVMENDGQNIAVGMAFPGLKDSLSLDCIEEAKDVNLPDYVELTADVTEFELDFTANISSPIGFSEIEDSDLNDVDDLMNSMDELGSASDALVQGTGTLLEGMKAYESAMSQYTGGVEQLNNGVVAITQALSEAAGQSSSGMEAVSAAARALSADAQSLGQMQASLGELQTLAGNLAAYTAAVDAARSSLWNAAAAAENIDAEATAQAAEQARAAANYDSLTPEEQAVIDAAIAGIRIDKSGDVVTAIADAQTQLDAIDTSGLALPDLTQLNTVLTDMQTQLQTLAGFSDSLSGLTAGMTRLNDALTQLSSGAGQLAANNSQVMSGIQQLVTGTTSLQAGMKTFDSEGIKKLTELSNGNMKKVVRRIKAVREAEIQYKEADNGARKDKSFIIETK